MALSSDGVDDEEKKREKEGTKDRATRNSGSGVRAHVAASLNAIVREVTEASPRREGSVCGVIERREREIQRKSIALLSSVVDFITAGHFCRTDIRHLPACVRDFSAG